MALQNTTRDVLVVDDEKEICTLISEILKDGGFSPRTAQNSTEAFAQIESKVPSAIILDIWLRGSEMDGIAILEAVKKRYPLMPVIVISGHGTVQTAVTAIKLGAYNFLEKPFTQEQLMVMLRRACESSRLKRENLDLKSKIVDNSIDIIGVSSCIAKLKSQIEKIAPTAGRVLIHGSAGVGKELFARSIHKKSQQANGPFIRFSPTGMSIEQVQQALFGQSDNELGAELTSRVSAFEAAHNGTLYIDEVTDLPLRSQVQLLQVIQDQVIYKQGKAVKVNVRVIASTAKDMRVEIENNRFGADLYYRLNVIPLNIPDLSSRKEDIPVLVEHFVEQLVRGSGLKNRTFADEAIAVLQAYNWPGNIRELRNVVEWAMIMHPVNTDEDRVIRFDMLPQTVLQDSAALNSNGDNLIDVMSLPLREAREMFEKQYLSAQMNRFNNNISKTSAFIGMERSALHRKLKFLNIYTAGGKFRMNDMDYGGIGDILSQ